MEIVLSAEQIQSNFETHLQIIETYLTGERKDKVLKMVEDLVEKVDYMMTPASSRTHLHGSFPGGYIAHVNTVVNIALRLSKMYTKLGGKMNFTEEELVFSALFHDLGKTGNGEKPNYVPQTSEWHVKNRGEVYTYNPEIDFMLIPDRSLYILQKYGITLSQNEYLGIMLHDGLYEKTNEPYLISAVPTSQLRSNLVAILHSADFLASRLEVDIR